MKSNFELIDKNLKRLSFSLRRFSVWRSKTSDQLEARYEEYLGKISSYSGAASSTLLRSARKVRELVTVRLNSVHKDLIRQSSRLVSLARREKPTYHSTKQSAWRTTSIRSWLKKYSYAPLFIGIGVMMMGASLLHRYTYFRALAFDEKRVDEYESLVQAPQRPAVPTHIFIEWYVDVGVEEEVFANGEWTVSETQASHLASSARPGESGNIIFYGHNKREILGNIRALKGYETIEITTADGKKHLYKVQSLHEVKPTDVSWLQPTREEVLTIYTCSGFMDRNRFIVRATPVSN